MRRTGVFVWVFVAALAWATTSRAQNKPAESGPATATAAAPQLKLQIVLSEMDGSKKVGVLPYTMYVPSAAGSPTSKLRAGMRVPVATGTTGGQVQYQYLDVGTLIDASAKLLDNGRYSLHLSVEKSSVYSAGSEQAVGSTPGGSEPGNNPLIRTIREEFDLQLRDGQTLQAGSFADPITGHLLLMDVTIEVEK